MTTEVTLATELVELGEQLPKHRLVDAAVGINYLCGEIYERNVQAGWWTNPKTGERLYPGFEPSTTIRNTGLVIGLIHSEVTEALEGFRKDQMDDHLPHRKMAEVELADTIIRVFDLAGAYGMDLGGAMLEKLAYNKQREDHKLENRNKPNGKQF